LAAKNRKFIIFMVLLAAENNLALFSIFFGPPKIIQAYFRLSEKAAKIIYAYFFAVVFVAANKIF
jgi:hypothetical protein